MRGRAAAADAPSCFVCLYSGISVASTGLPATYIQPVELKLCPYVICAQSRHMCICIVIIYILCFSFLVLCCPKGSGLGLRTEG